MKKLLAVLSIAVLAGIAAGPRPAYADDNIVATADGVAVLTATPPKSGKIAFSLPGDINFNVPFTLVSGVQLYSPELGKGFPGLETVLAQRKTWRLSLGAAPVLGTAENVPFLSLSTRLSPRFFDTADNELYFGAWAGKPSNGKHVIFGLSASVALW